ncbi:MAG: hypothetical protein PWR10_2232 [Halanaerobiales bacterium]|nr:hypothetical protein [Halanaerobiales bacterium]
MTNAQREITQSKNNQGRRKLPRILSIIVSFVAIGLAGFHLYTAYFGVLTPMLQRAIHLFGTLLLAAFIYPPLKKSESNKITWYDILIIIFITGLGVFFIMNLSPDEILNRGIWGPDQMEIWAGLLLIIFVLEFARRSIGLPIVIVGAVFLVYVFFGPYMPSIFSHKGYDLYETISFLVWSNSGIFGIPLGVAATFVIIFILFGAFLDELGGGDFFLKMAYAISGQFKGGPAKTSILASGLMGSISGSAVANVVTTGAFTIPLMKKTGYKSYYAGAVEAVASTGGQIMPPVMGAGAFVLAEMAGFSYPEVVLAAAIPAVLYYLSLGFMVHFEADKLGLKGIPREELPNPLQVLKKGFYLILPLGVLIYLLIFLRYSPMRAGIFTIITLLTISIIQFIIREKRFPLQEILRAMEKGVKTAIPVATACATAGIVIGVVSLTGLGVRFSQLIISISGGNLILALFFVMIACIILGMGLPTTAAYIITATLGVPALVKLGVPLMAAHLFVFYFAIISFITPPVAISAYAASGLAGSNAMRTGFQAFKLGLAGFIVPYMFVFSPTLILIGTPLKIILSIITAIIGVFALAASMENWIFSKLNLWQRVLLLIASLTLIKSGWKTDLIGIVVVLIIFILQFRGVNHTKKIGEQESSC